MHFIGMDKEFVRRIVCFFRTSATGQCNFVHHRFECYDISGSFMLLRMSHLTENVSRFFLKNEINKINIKQAFRDFHNSGKSSQKTNTFGKQTIENQFMKNWRRWLVSWSHNLFV